MHSRAEKPRRSPRPGTYRGPPWSGAGGEVAARRPSHPRWGGAAQSLPRPLPRPRPSALSRPGPGPAPPPPGTAREGARYRGGAARGAPCRAGHRAAPGRPLSAPYRLPGTRREGNALSQLAPLIYSIGGRGNGDTTRKGRYGDRETPYPQSRETWSHGCGREQVSPPSCTPLT